MLRYSVVIGWGGVGAYRTMYGARMRAQSMVLPGQSYEIKRIPESLQKVLQGRGKRGIGR